MDVVVYQCKPVPIGKSVGALTVILATWPYGRQVSDFTLSGKTSKESTRCPYPKPTQVDKVNMHTPSRERLLKN